MAKLQIIGVIGFLEFWRENAYVLKVFGLGARGLGLGVGGSLSLEFWRENAYAVKVPTAVQSPNPHP